MTHRTAQAVTAVLALLLVLLLVAGFLVHQRAASGRGGDQAQLRIATTLEDLQSRVRRAHLPQEQEHRLLHGLDQQLELLDREAVSAATPSPSASAADEDLSAAYQQGAQAVFAQALEHGQDAQTASVWAGIAVSLWATDTVRTGSAQELAAADSPARTSLARVLEGGAPQGTGSETVDGPQGVCPGTQAPEGKEASPALQALARELDRAVWAEQTWSARTGAQDPVRGQLAAALDVDQAESTALATGARGCGSLPAPRSGYRLPQAGPEQALGQEQHRLAAADLDLLAEQSLGQADTRATARWAAQELALHTVLEARSTGTVPALPGR